MSQERNVCTKEKPMPKDAPGRWAHTNAHEVGEQEDGYPRTVTRVVTLFGCGVTIAAPNGKWSYRNDH